MGCSSSKIDDLPAVALCRDRCNFLDNAIHHRHAFSQAHLSYLHSLKAVGLSLVHFFDHHHLLNSTAPPINLPPQRKDGNTAVHNHYHRSHSGSGSHLHFPDSYSDDSASDSPLHHTDNDFPSHLNYPDHEPLSSYQVGDFMGMGMNMNMNYMKNKATPSLSYEQRPVNAETVYMGESSSSSNYPPRENPPSASSYSNYGNYGGGPGINGFFGSPPSYGSSYAAAGPIETAEALTSKKPPPPPPSPPRNSGWDFLNPFESFEKYYHVHTLSRGSKELRDEEGIPDLEYEDEQEEEEVVKEVQVERKFVDSGNYAKGVAEESDSDSLYRTRPDHVSMINDTGDYEVPVVDKKVVNNEGSLGNVAAFKAQDDSEVVREIQLQFDRASKSGDEVAKMLEVQTFSHKRNSAYRVSSKMLHAVAPSLAVASSHPSTSEIGGSSIDKADPALLEIDEEKLIGSVNLSSTLQKLHLWEKKLYDEVMAEEKLRVLHDKKALKLKRLDEKGAEAHKIDVTRTLVRSLSTKIGISIQAVDKISVEVNKLRDEELWPQLNEFIQGLTRMWKSMLQCHHSQCQAIGQAKRLDAVALQKYLSDSRLEAVLQLEHELLNWTSAFFSWVCAQKGFVQALNSWLLKCLLYVPEVTPDGIVPFSPSRIGAPPVFVICNQWSQAMEIISEKEVVKSMRDFATNVLQLWERNKLEMQQRGMANKDMERQVKKLEREDQKIQKEIQALDKKMVLVYGDGNGISLSGSAVYQSDTRKTVSLQVSLLRTFEALEGFIENSMRAYDELLKRIEEDRRDRLGHGSEEVP